MSIAASLGWLPMLVIVQPVMADPIGRLPGELNITSFGTAAYSVPIAVAPGINGMRPNLALVYGSRGGDGWLDRRWSIAGLSRIRRCGKTIATHGVTTGVRYSTQDRFCLDGVVLIAPDFKSNATTNTAYGANGTEYRKELHDHERIRSYGTLGSGAGVGPRYFEVETGNGWIFQYGFDSDSRLLAANNPDGAVDTWMLNEIRDRYGNRVYFSYDINPDNDPSTMDYEPTTIRWTTKTGQAESAAPYKIKFNFDDRPDEEVRTGYRWGVKWIRRRRLLNLEYYYNGVLVHRYTPTYQNGRVVSIAQCGPTECLPATNFQWHPRAEGWPEKHDVASTIDVAASVVADINGDGADDLLSPEGGKWKLYLADPANGDYLSAINTNIAANGDGIAVELNGDGRSEFIALGSGTSYAAYKFNGSAGSPNLVALSAYNFSLPATASVPTFLDIDGDGLTDLVYIDGATGYLRAKTAASFASASSVLTGLSASGEWYAIQRSGPPVPVDFDGDGRDDLLLRGTACGGSSCGDFLEAYLSTGTGFDQANAQAVPLGSIGSYEPVRLGDVNGDGLTDVVAWVESSKEWHAAVSTGRQSGVGSGFLAPPVTCAQNGHATSTNLAEAQRAVLADSNGDGRAELVRAGLPGPVYIQAHIFNEDENCFEDALSGYWDYAANWANVEAITTAHVIGNEQIDLVVKTDTSVRVRRALTRYLDVLYKVTDGLGNEETISYTPLSQMNSYSVAGTSANPDQYRIDGGRFLVVDAVERPTGQGDDTYTEVFSYENGEYNRAGRGFVGFQTITRAEERAQATISTETKYYVSFPNLGRVLSETVRNADTQTDIFHSSHSWSTDIYTNGGQGTNANGEAYYSPKQSHATATTYETDQSSPHLGDPVRESEDTYYYFNGLAVYEIHDYQLLNSGATSELQVSRVPQSFSDASWCIGRPAQETVTRIHDSQTRQRSRTLAWGTHCELTTETNTSVVNDTTKQLRTVYDYDSTIGTLTAVTLDSVDGAAADRRTEFGYDSNDLRVTQSKQLISGQSALITNVTWNYGLGLQSSVTDPRGEVTSWLYDDFGRVTTMTQPGPTTSYISYTACDAACSNQAVYKIRTDVGSPTSTQWNESYRDKFGRNVGEAVSLIAGSSRVERTLDEFGRVVSESVPYIGGPGQAAATVNYTYDIVGRLRSEQRPAMSGTGTTTQTIAYDLNKTTVIDHEGKQTGYTYDQLGQLTQVVGSDPGATFYGGGAAYTYWPFGELRTTTDAEGTVNSFVYDEKGLRTTVNDANSGVWTYQYNVFGELTRRTDDQAVPNVMSITYDQLGRRTTRTEPEGTTTWLYHQNGAGLGLLASAEQTQGAVTTYRQTYAYDASGRLKTTSTTIPGNPMRAFDYTYTTQNQLREITYPATLGSERPKFTYAYANGYLDTIVRNTVGGDVPIFAVSAQGPRGRPATMIFGAPGASAIYSRHIFDPNTLALHGIETGTGAGATDIQQYQYQYYDSGAVKSRQNLNAAGAPTESFSYDALYRLKSASAVGGSPALTLTYDGSGNIMSKSDVGQYYYGENGAGPHAVSRIDDDDNGPNADIYFAYDHNGNMVCRGGTDANCAGGDSISWYSWNKPKQVSYGSDSAEFFYGPGRRRYRQINKDGGVERDILYYGRGFEVETQGNETRYRTSVYAGGQLVYQLFQTASSGACPVISENGYFVHLDSLGSVDYLSFAHGSGMDQAFSFDAFGKRRHAETWQADPTDQLLDVDYLSNNGYTNHEQVDNVRLIHMNGRMQDPHTGRMISADPPDIGRREAPQSFNRYSYVSNSPLSYTDPSGFFKKPLDELVTSVLRPPTGGGLSSFSFGVSVGGGNSDVGFRDRGPFSADWWSKHDSDADDDPDTKSDSEDENADEGMPKDEVVATAPRPPKRPKRRFASERALFDALSPGDGVFGKRPLELPILSYLPVEWTKNLIDDFLNTELLHEQFFYKDVNGKTGNSGYFRDKGGRVMSDPNFPGNISDYEFGPIQEGVIDDTLTLHPSGFSPGKYDLIRNNCQSYCDAIRDQF